MTVKKLIGQVHLWLGLASGLVVLIVTLTGATLVFEKELDELVNHRFYFVEPGTSPRLTLDDLVQRAAAHDLSWKLTNIQLETAQANRTVLFSGKKNGNTWLISINPYTGKVVEMVEDDARFFSIVLHLHRYLLMKETGKVITGISCLMFLSIILTGLVLWWPKRIKTLKKRLSIKWDGKFKRLNWDLHAVGGFYVHLVIFIIAFTGLTWAYPWFNNGIFTLFDGKPQQRIEPVENLVKQSIAPGYFEMVYADANKRLSYKGKMTITVPVKDNLGITLSKENYEAGYTNVVDFLFYERGTGRLLKKRLYKDETRGMKVRRIVFPIHTGNIYGWPTKILAFCSVLFAASLPVTGFIVWIGRKKKNKKPRGAKATVKIPLVAERIQS